VLGEEALDLDEKLEPFLELVEHHLKDKQLVAHMRRDRVARKSLQRDGLWEPLIDIWNKCGLPVRYSEGGPLERFITAVCVAIGEEPPKSLSLREAIDEWRS
jgi:hypothetical protein